MGNIDPTQHIALKPEALYCLKCKYGTLCDYAVAADINLAKRSDKRIFHSPNGISVISSPQVEGQRFSISAAQFLVAQLVLGVNSGAASGAGFELAVLSWLTLHLPLAHAPYSATLLYRPCPESTVALTPREWIVHVAHAAQQSCVANPKVRVVHCRTQVGRKRLGPYFVCRKVLPRIRLIPRNLGRQIRRAPAQVCCSITP